MMKHIAVGAAFLALVIVIGAIALRPGPAEPVCRAEYPQVTPPDAAPPADPIVVAGPPKIEAAKVKASTAALGVELQVDTALTMPGIAAKQESVRIKASCKLDGEWYDGSGYVSLSKLPVGTSVVPSTVRIGTQQAFKSLPTECQLAFEYASFAEKPMRRESIARMCWTANQVKDGACAVAKSDAVAVSGLRVETGYRRRVVGAPITLDVSVDAQLQRPLEDWSIQVSADCTLPDGTSAHTSGRVSTYGVHAGRPFNGRAYLQKIADVPTQCTFAVELADRSELVRAPVSAYCWKDGVVADGSC
jgi:hypothetical protein